MPEPEESPHPLAGLRIRVLWNGTPLPGVRRVGPLRRTTDVVSYHEAGEPGPSRKLPGRTEYDPFHIELSVGPDMAFEQWAGIAAAAGGREPPPELRSALRIEVHTATGEVLVAYDVHRCWVSQYQALPDLDGYSGTAPAVYVRVEHEGWERDAAVPAPVDPVDPADPVDPVDP